MKDTVELIKEVGKEALAGSRYRQFTHKIQDGRVRYNMLGGEVDPQPEKGVILAHRDGWYIQKTGVNKFSAHKESLMPFPLNVDDKVEIKHSGFSSVDTKEGKEAGMSFRTITMSRKHLEAPDHPIMKDMVEQLSGLSLPDGRRGLRPDKRLRIASFFGALCNRL